MDKDRQPAIESNRPQSTIDGDVMSSRLTALIDFELARSDAAETRVGWSKWALVGALGTLGWLVLGELQNESLRWSIVVWAVICASILEDLFRELSTVLDHSSKRALGQPRFFLSNTGDVRAAIAGQLARFGVLLIVAAVAAMPGPAWAHVVFLTYTSLMFVLATLTILITFIPFPFPRAPPTKFTLVPSLIRLALLVILVTGFGLGLQGMPHLVHADELRLGALLWAAGFVAILLLNTSPSSPLTTTLRDIRREISLGVLDVETAQREVDIALRGLRVSDLLHEDVGRLLEIWRGAISRLEAASAKLTAFVDALPQSDEPLSLAQQHLARAILQELKESDESNAKSFAKLGEALSKFKATAGRIIASTHLLRVNVKGDFFELAERIDQMQRLYNTKAEELLIRRQALAARVESKAEPVQA